MTEADEARIEMRARAIESRAYAEAAATMLEQVSRMPDSAPVAKALSEIGKLTRNAVEAIRELEDLIDAGRDHNEA